MRLVGVYNAPALVTLVGLSCSIVACWLALAQLPAYAMVAFIWAGIFDLFDGVVARRSTLSPLQSNFGIQIDSLVDAISFGVTPLIIVHGLGADSFITLAIGVLYCCAVVQRLAYFNVLQAQADGGLKTYTGLPVTFAVLIFGIGFSVRPLVSDSVFSLTANAMLLIVAILYVVPVKIPKPQRYVYIAMPLLALLFTLVWLYIARYQVVKSL